MVLIILDYLNLQLLFTVILYILWIILYIGLTILTLQKYRKKCTKLSLIFALTVFSTTIFIISLLGQTYALQSNTGFNNSYRLFALSSLWSQGVIFFFLYVMANTFFFKWSIRSEWLLAFYYSILLVIETIGIYNNFGWQIYGSGIYASMVSDITFEILLYIIPFIIVLFLSFKFFVSAKQIKDPKDIETKRAIQFLSLGYLVYNIPFLTLPLLVFVNNQIIFYFITLTLLNAPIITYMLLYIAFYRPEWFKRRFERKTWISSVLR